MSSKFGFESADTMKAKLRQKLVDRSQKLDRDLRDVIEDWCRVQGWEGIKIYFTEEHFIDDYLEEEGKSNVVAVWTLIGSGRYWPEEITYWYYTAATRREFVRMPQEEREQMENEHLRLFSDTYDVTFWFSVRPDMSENLTVEWSKNIKYFQGVSALFTVVANTTGVPLYFQTTRYVEMTCGYCEGSGYMKCPDCQGRGVNWEQPTSSRRTRCSLCNGEGRRECEECERSGKKVGPEEKWYVCNPQSESASDL